MPRPAHLLALLFMALFGLLFALAGRAPTRAAPLPPVAYQLYHLAFNKNHFGIHATLQLSNLSNATATAAITFVSTLPGGGTYVEVRSIAANSVLVIPEADFTNVPDGSYTVIVDSDLPLDSVVHQQDTIGEDPLSIYLGATAISTTHNFGPFLKGDYISTVALFNAGAATAIVSASVYDVNGVPVYTQNANLLPQGRLILHPGAMASLPPGFVGWLRVTSDQPLTSLMQQFRPSPYDIEHYPEMDRSGVVPFQAIARALKGADEGSGPRTTALFIANPNMISSTATLYLSNAGGIAYTANYTLPSNGGTLIDLADVVGLSDGIYSAVANGSQPLMLGSYTYHSNAAVYPVGDYETPIALSVRLPYVARTDATHTVFSLQNLGAAVATITVSYYTNAGISVYDQVVSNLAPGQAQRFDHRQMTDLPDSFTGYAIATANGQPIQGIVDEYLVPLCYPVSSAHIDQMPTNPIYTLTPVTFTAAATGTLPFSYTWTLDGAPLGGNQNLLEHTFTAPGNYTIGVTVTNACGAAQAEQSITVQPLPPDLSASHKLVSLAQVTNGDVLTYTLMLHNSNASPATAVITDPLPAHTTYLPDSVWASSGVITFTAGEMRWYGPIISGTPVLLQFAAQLNAAGLTPGDIVTNTAQLDDGLGNVSTLRASSIFNPGYRLAIDDGALYTNIPTVTLALSWASEIPPITQMDISNDGGFSAGTGWIAVSSSYAPWMLTTYGALTLPRVAYARFRDGNGQIYGPVQDDIIYDPIAPQVAQVTIITQTQVLRPTGHQSVIVRVASGDDNSGVSEIEISDHADLATGQSFPATGATTDVVWSLQPSGWVYVRAIDRAGNVSAISAARLPTDFKVYLPTLFRQFP